MHLSSFSFPGINAHGPFGQSPGASSPLTSINGQVAQSTSIAKVEQGLDGLKIFNSELSRTYDFLATRGTSKVSALVPEKLTAESVANNILGFIENRLKKDKAEGASEEELAERLEQGLAGFKKGFAEAKEKIDALGFLSPEIADDIGKTYELVTGGIDDLRAQYVEGKTKEIAENIRPSVAPGAVAANASVSYGQWNSFDFEVETADGDTVTIKASSKNIYAAQYSYGTFNNADSQGYAEAFSAYASQSSRFSFSVEGELDEGEIQALNDLMGKVEDLSVQFFSGNLDEAFNQALNIGYDSQEIVGYSLNLRQVEVERVQVAYQQFAPVDTEAVAPLSRQLMPLGNFVQDLLDALDSGNKFADPAQLVADIAEQFDVFLANLNGSYINDAGAKATAEQSPDRFSRFVKSVLDTLPSSHPNDTNDKLTSGLSMNGHGEGRHHTKM